MTNIYLIRHGMAASAWGEHADPGLSDPGRQQAAQVARQMRHLGPLPVVTSPLLRTFETAAAFEAAWGVKALIEPRVAELPCPVMEPQARQAWLEAFAGSDWPDVSETLRQWRDTLIDFITSLSHDTVITTHFVAINAIAGAALNRAATLHFHPGNASCTHVSLSGKTLRVLSLGHEDGHGGGFRV